ncbi:Arm DNA-binding domain-containing protein [Collinsella sp. AK_207A]|uniref:Arm DNA-binding domain-containing protein n=1 Tax=Collinsella sp. AK_207A TaxID=2650472 RepID=UPI00358FD635
MSLLTPRAEDGKARGRFRASEIGLIDFLDSIQVLSGLFRFGCPHRLFCQRWRCRLLFGNEVHKCKRGFATAEEARAWEEAVRPIGGPS